MKLDMVSDLGPNPQFIVVIGNLSSDLNGLWISLIGSNSRSVIDF